ncbi:MAG: hypothetical protein IPG46_11770 [Actinobacteria bacterium]|nr:hypothetical protein [Actinomycetota bacterium]
MRRFRRTLAVIGVAAIAGCTTPPTISAAAPTWMFGDSLAGTTAASFLPERSLEVFNATRGGGGFVWTKDGLNIATEADTRIASYGAPRRALIIGGTNDFKLSAPVVIAAMAAFEDDLTAQGIEVVWITEPGWSHAGWLAQLNNWIRSRPGSIDCAPAIADAKYTSPWDQVHPTDDGYNRYADCIAENLPPLG